MLKKVLKGIRWAFAGLLVIGVGLYVAPFLDANPEQDACSFGSVSNAEYRRLLAEAHRLSETEWEPFTAEKRGREAFEGLLEARLQSLVPKQETLDGQVAAMHAVMRASKALGGGGWFGVEYSSLTYRYFYDVNRMGVFMPFRRWARIRISFQLDPDDLSRPAQAVFSTDTDVVFTKSRQETSPRPFVVVNAMMPNWLETYPNKQFYWGHACPGAPASIVRPPAVTE